MIRGEPGVIVAASDEAATEPTVRRNTLWRRFRTHRPAMVSLVGVIVVLLAAGIGPQLYTTSATQVSDLLNPQMDAFPSWVHPFGTDALGRDILARVLAGLRVSLGVVALVETINVVLGTLSGLLAGYLGRWVDGVVSRVADVLFAFPGLLLAILVAGIFGPAVGDAYGGLGRLALVAASLALVSWPLMARYVRAETLSLRHREFIAAGVAMGLSHRRIMLRHILPNVVGLILTAATLDAASVAVNEAVLSLLGLGVQPPNSSIGLMINDGIRQLNTNAYEVLFPAAVLTLLVLFFSFLGDGLRDAFDVRTDNA